MFFRWSITLRLRAVKVLVRLHTNAMRGRERKETV